MTHHIKKIVLATLFLPFLCSAPIMGAGKTKEQLSKMPRLGRTSAELEILWGKPTDRFYQGVGVGLSSIPGLKPEHRKYLRLSNWSGFRYEVDTLRLSVGFYDDKAIAIFFWSTDGALSFEEAEKVAQVLTRTSWLGRPANTNQYFCIYSNDLKQRYLLQKSSRYTVIDMELVKKQFEKPKITPSINNL